jgi:hypothetical protein
VTGAVPFPGGTALEKVICHRTQEPAPAQALRRDLPPPVARVIRRLMAKKPAERYPTCADLLADLDRLVADGPDTVVDDGSKTLVSMRNLAGSLMHATRLRRWLDWRLLSTVVVLLVLTGWLAWRGDPTGPAAALPGPARPAPRPTLAGPWHIAGPFDLHRDAYRSLAPLGTAIDLGHTYPGKGGARVTWQPLTEFRAGDAINLRRFLHNEHASAFLYTRVELPHAMTLPVALSADDTLAVWLNGELVYSHPKPRGLADPDRTLLPLRAGVNELLIKVGNLGGAWAVSVQPSAGP